MKRWIAFVLCIQIALSGCAQIKKVTDSPAVTAAIPTGDQGDVQETTASGTVAEADYLAMSTYEKMAYLEQSIGQEIAVTLDNNSYTLDAVDARYVSEAYLETISYNSKENIFFGYTLTEVEAAFKDTAYVFSLGEDGTTVVEPFVETTSSMDMLLKSVSIGAGIILITVSVIVITQSGPTVVNAVISLAKTVFTKESVAKVAKMAALIVTGYIKGTQTDDLGAVLSVCLDGSNLYRVAAFVGMIAANKENQ